MIRDSEAKSLYKASLEKKLQFLDFHFSNYISPQKEYFYLCFQQKLKTLGFNQNIFCVKLSKI